MAEVSREEVEHVAQLARMALTSQDLERVGTELNRILEHFNRLQELDTEDVAPTSHAIPMTNVFREDQVGESLSVEDVVENAPERSDDFFKVPRIVED
jgi:aspartyl-tRNA(Asn)/glutamyl-tRNA(Gln) amidotransferase subunit C